MSDLLMKPIPLSLALLIALGLPVTAHAFEPFVVKSIRVEGVQRTETGTVFNYLPVKVGDRVDPAKVREAIQALFGTGFYNDVRIEAENGVLIVSLDERPVIASMRIDGAKEFDADQLIKALRDNGLAESRTFDRSLLETAEQELKKQYFSRGYYAVQVKTTVSRLERNRVALSFDISEGLVAKIRQVNLVGNKSYSEKDLLDYFQLGPPGWFSWFSKNDQYSKPKLQADIEALRTFYLDRGYLEFSIDSQQVALSDDKKDVFLTINITEGQKYTFTDIKFAGELVVPEAEIRAMVDIKPGDVFARSRISAITERIVARLGDEGYAFVNVNAVPDVNKEKGTAAFTFYVDPGRKTYVRRVNVSGNSRTRDEVVRREIRQMEAAPYSSSKIKRSKERLDLLGYFSEVNVDTPLVPETTDQVDMNVSVVEKQTGNIQLGAGYSQNDGFILSGSISQSNVFGSGNFLKLELNTSQSTKVYAISFTNPYATPDGVSRGFDIYKRDYEPNIDSIGNYKEDSAGVGLRWSVPVSEFNSIQFGISVQQSELTLFDDSPQSYIDFVEKNGSDNITLLGTVGWSRDTRDSSIFPTKGSLRRVSAEVAVPGGDIKYFKINGQQQWFTPLSKDFTFLVNTDVGYGKGYGGSTLPFYTHFFAGGVSSVRGFESSSLGPRDKNGDSIGGNRRIVNNLELLFPVPGLNNEKSVRMSAFFDTGGVWGEDEKLNFSDLRYSSGVALTWLAPIGPLKFSIATPVKDKPGDRAERFQFSLGRVF